jgi:hypothetical protein
LWSLGLALLSPLIVRFYLSWPDSASLGVDAGIGAVPERESVRGAAVLVKNVSFAPLGRLRGLKPRIIFASDAALKRRSSTVLPAVSLCTPKPQGLKAHIHS